MKIKVLRNSPQTNMGCFVRSLFSETIHTVSKLQFKILEILQIPNYRTCTGQLCLVSFLELGI